MLYRKMAGNNLEEEEDKIRKLTKMADEGRKKKKWPAAELSGLAFIFWFYIFSVCLYIWSPSFFFFSSLVYFFLYLSSFFVVPKHCNTWRNSYNVL